jgi:hypothetical protein
MIMKWKRIPAAAATLACITLGAITGYGHGGRTDSNGGHTDSRTGSYHYHGKSISNPALAVASQSVTATQKSTASTANAHRAKITENHWQVAFNNAVTHGQLETTTASGRVDILTTTHAIEVDRVEKYQEGVSQALRYASDTGKKPGLALYLDGQANGVRLYLEAETICEKEDIQLWLINDHVAVQDLIELSTALHTTDSAPDDANLGYWLNSSSNVRHNQACRYFKNTAKGRSCGPNDGRPCSICGG